MNVTSSVSQIYFNGQLWPKAWPSIHSLESPMVARMHRYPQHQDYALDGSATLASQLARLRSSL